MSKPRRRIYMQMGGVVVVLFAVGFGATTSPKIFNIQYEKPVAQVGVNGDDIGTDGRGGGKPSVSESARIVATHLKTPEPVKAIYMTQCVVGTKSFREKLIKVADTTEINAIVIDIKDYSGRIGFKTDNPRLLAAVSDTCRADDMLEFVDLLHQKNIYAIGRITVFQDPYMAKSRPDLAVRKLSDGGVWKDHKGLSFIDVGAREHWDYIIELSKEAYKLGFDELNFDYIRFPSDGNMKDVSYSLSRGKSKPEALEEFFAYLREQLNPDGDSNGVMMSADLFGMVTTNKDDLNIGQVLERAMPHFDYIAPMVYPSHYPPKFNGWSNPNKYPYEVVKFAMDSAVTRAKEFDRSFGTSTPELRAKYNANSAAKLRPWLQDFDYGGNYDVAEVKAQIKATNDAGLASWMLWAPSNIYTVGALDKL